MILLYKLKDMERALKSTYPLYSSQLKAIALLREALLNIDFKVEQIPDHSFNKLQILFEDILNRKLVEEEIRVLKKITEK